MGLGVLDSILYSFDLFCFVLFCFIPFYYILARPTYSPYHFCNLARAGLVSHMRVLLTMIRRRILP